jgi:type II secretory pathway predicted ATPase ExeA
MPYNPLILKRLILDCGIVQSELARAAGVHKATVNVCINRGFVPSTVPDFHEKCEKFISSRPDAMKWLTDRGLQIADIWKPEGSEMRKHNPKGLVSRSWRTRKTPAMIPGDATKIYPPSSPLNKGGIEGGEEVEMLTSEAMRHFKLFRNPFINDIKDVQDIYLSDEHRYIKEVMLDAARNQGFVAVVGEVGSGKSAIRKYVVEELSRDESVRIIFPRMIDKTRVTAASLCDAIIMDLCDETPKLRLEQKSRQVEKHLISRVKSGGRTCLMIEEAHDLTVRVLKLLKRIYEIEHGYKKAVGILLIGQPELGSLFNEQDHYEMREVIRRCQIAYIRGLNGNIKDYLSLKFKRAGAEISKIIDDKAIDMISKRLTDIDDRKRKISNAYPLTVNNLVIRAMNEAYEMGFDRITTEVMQAI